MVRSDILEKMEALKVSILGSCESCDGSGYQPPEEPGEINACDCMKVLHYLNELVVARIPRDYWSLPLDTLEVKQHYIDFCNWYLERIHKAAKSARGILFLGPNGIGKTSMQCAIGKAAVVAGYKVKYFTAQQYIEAKKNDDELLADFEDADFVLLDEMDKVYVSKGSNFVPKTLEDFLRRLTSGGTTFIICTNHDSETLSGVFGQSTMSMLKRHLKFIEVDGSDFSDTLQDSWGAAMEEDHQYLLDEHIVDMASRMWSREQEEERRAWEKIHRK